MASTGLWALKLTESDDRIMISAFGMSKGSTGDVIELIGARVSFRSCTRDKADSACEGSTSQPALHNNHIHLFETTIDN